MKCIKNAVVVFFALSILFCGLLSIPLKSAAAQSSSDIASMIHIYNDPDEVKEEEESQVYLPENRNWQGLPYIAVTESRIWVTLYSGGVAEPDPNGLNYTALAYSEDNGKTWVDPYIVFDNPGKNSYMSIWTDPNGRLYLYFIVQTEGRDYYMYEYYTDNPDAKDIQDIQWVGRRSTKGASSKPYVIINEKGQKEWLSFQNYRILSSVDGGTTWQEKGECVPHEDTLDYLDTDEPSLYQCTNGDLVALFRIGNGALGGVQKFVSKDFGKTWSEGEFNLGAPYQSPGSKIASMTLDSGAILICSHDNTTSIGGATRKGLTLYLSDNDGVSWYSLVLESRESSYPEIFQDKDGTIYVAYDRGRYTTNSIRLTILNEQDIKNGFYSDKMNHNIKVAGIGITKDIEQVNIPSEIEVPLGTSYEDVLQKFPEKIEIYDEDGKKYEIDRKDMLSYSYKPDREGVYMFEVSSWPENLLDVHELLKVNVVVKESPVEGGCNSSVYGGTIVVVGLVSAFLIICGIELCCRKIKK